MLSNAVFGLVFSLFFLMGSVHSSLAQSSTDQVRISDIKVEGNLRVADGTVKSYLSIQVGDLTSLNALSNALSGLYDTDLFQDIKLDLDDSVLIVSVVENPIVNRVNVEGNDAFSDDILLDVIDVQPRRVFNRKVAIDATRRLIEVYRQGGRFAAVIEPKIIELDENRIDLVFEVNEGPLIKIDSISFFGNIAFSDQELSQRIASREKRWWAFLSANDKYDEGRLDYDVRLLRQFYLSRGYADINVERALGGLLPDRSGFAITFLVEEGIRYEVNEVSVSREITGIDLDKMANFIDFGDEPWYDVRHLEQGLLNISKELGSLGYAFVNVTPVFETDVDTAKLDIKINIEEARRNFVERIEFVNNVRTTDRVLRREFEIVEGDAFNQLKIDRSIRNVRNLGFFSNVEVQTLSGSKLDQSVTKVTVEEQSTGDFTLGLGYSSLDQTSVTVGINERNFLGTGRRATMALSTSGTSTDFNIGLSEPHFMGRNLTGTFDAFKMKTSSGDSNSNESGFTAGVDYFAARDVSHKIRYNLSQTKTTLSSTNATSITGENNKSRLRSSVTYILSQDTRNNRFDPSEGSYLELDETIAGLGGDVKFLRTKLSAAYYKPLLFQSVILGVSGKLGHIAGLGDKVTRSQHFYLGGRDIRGFDGSGLGPRDTGSQSAVGGTKMYSGRFEVISSIGLNEDTGIRWTVFSDFGSLWDTDYPTGVTQPNASNVRSSLGAGFFWSTAIGPLSFSWAKPLSKMPHDTTRTFQFNIGTRL